MFKRFKRKPFFTKEEKDYIVNAIRVAEHTTSGEIRLFIEHKCKYVDALDRAAEIFYTLKMDKTQLHNGVLLYVAVDDKQLAIFGDKGIYEKMDKKYWENQVQKMITQVKANQLLLSISNCIKEIGATLKDQFPYDASIDKNELPDEIVFGN